MFVYYWHILQFAINPAWAIAELVAGVLALVFGYIAWKYPHWESKMKNPLWMIPLAVFLSILMIRLIIAPYVMYTEQQQTIMKLREAAAQKEQDTKQDIRTFLEIVNPKILTKVDAGQEEIHVYLGASSQAKLKNLSELPNFAKFLSFNQVNRTMQGINYDGNDPDIISAVKQALGDFIPELNEQGFAQGYCLYPKDALRQLSP